MGADKMAGLMLKHAWMLHRTQKTIVFDQEDFFILQVTKGPNQNLAIQINLSTYYHLRTDG